MLAKMDTHSHSVGTLTSPSWLAVRHVVELGASSSAILEHDESSEAEDDIECEDREVLKRGTQAIVITRDYVPHWSCQDAFRELYQNW